MAHCETWRGMNIQEAAAAAAAARTASTNAAFSFLETVDNFVSNIPPFTLRNIRFPASFLSKRSDESMLIKR